MRIEFCKIFQRVDFFNVRKENPLRLEITIVGKQTEIDAIIKTINLECAK